MSPLVKRLTPQHMPHFWLGRQAGPYHSPYLILHHLTTTLTPQSLHSPPPSSNIKRYLLGEIEVKLLQDGSLRPELLCQL